MCANYTYGKLRRDYGKQCRFSKCGPTVMVSLLPDISQEEQWIPKNPVNKYTNYSVEWSEHEVPTYLSISRCFRIASENQHLS